MERKSPPYKPRPTNQLLSHKERDLYLTSLKAAAAGAVKVGKSNSSERPQGFADERGVLRFYKNLGFAEQELIARIRHATGQPEPKQGSLETFWENELTLDKFDVFLKETVKAIHFECTKYLTTSESTGSTEKQRSATTAASTSQKITNGTLVDATPTTQTSVRDEVRKTAGDDKWRSSGSGSSDDDRGSGFDNSYGNAQRNVPPPFGSFLPQDSSQTCPLIAMQTQEEVLQPLATAAVAAPRPREARPPRATQTVLGLENSLANATNLLPVDVRKVLDALRKTIVTSLSKDMVFRLPSMFLLRAKRTAERPAGTTRKIFGNNVLLQAKPEGQRTMAVVCKPLQDDVAQLQHRLREADIPLQLQIAQTFHRHNPAWGLEN